MLAIERQHELDPALERLRKIPGVSLVEQDDFDKLSINIFVTLEQESRSKFISPIRTVKTAINRALEDLVGYGFLNQPTKQREYNGKLNGKTLWFDKGYDQDHIKLEIFI